jgi:hypothetical protein
MPVQAVFFRKPDGTKWVKFTLAQHSANDLPVIEIGVSAQWTDHEYSVGKDTYHTHYSLWPEGDNRLSGRMENKPWGTIDLTCK